MIRVRAVKESDEPSLWQLIEKMEVGVTSLPRDKTILNHKIKRAVESFVNPSANKPQFYFFIMEDTTTQQLIGCSGIKTQIGKESAFYSYRIEKIVQYNKELSFSQERELLLLVNDYQGATEICSLYLLPAYRNQHNGKLLSWSRFLFMANFMEHKETFFSDPVIAELCGVCDEKGHAPFWTAIGEKFFNMDFRKADFLTGLGRKQFITDLMPKYPIYVALLSAEAAAAIGKSNASSQAAEVMLKKQGFRFDKNVDIFDGGPMLESSLKNIAVVKNKQRCRIEAIVQNIESSTSAMIGVVNPPFFASVVRYIKKGDNLILSQEDAMGLNVKIGDEVSSYFDIQ